VCCVGRQRHSIEKWKLLSNGCVVNAAGCGKIISFEDQIAAALDRAKKRDRLIFEDGEVCDRANGQSGFRIAVLLSCCCIVNTSGTELK
jgi:hypothetical protein